MLFYTQLIFIKQGKEAPFLQFEDHVLPLLEQYNGKLLLRWRRTQDCVIEDGVDNPYELHLVSFETREDFVRYAQDETRKQYLALKDASVEKVMLIEGKLL